MSQLLIDMGNSRIKWYFDHTDAPLTAHTTPEAISHLDDELWPSKLYTAWRAHATPQRCLMSHVASQSKRAVVEDVLHSCFPDNPLELLSARATHDGLTLNYEPSQMGADRYAQLLGAHHLHADKNYLLISAGTATTVDGILKTGQHIGGMILPSVILMRQSLHQYTAKLPLSGGNIQTLRAPNNTQDALATAAQLATIGAIREFASSYMGDEPFDVLLCGGNAPDIAKALNIAQQQNTHILPSLCLLGLKHGFIKNQ